MGALIQDWFNKNIWDLSKKSTGATYDLKGTIARENIFGFSDNFSNEVVTERRAHQLSTVYSCLNVRARTVSALPINVIREKGNKKESLVDHPTYYPLAQQPNNYMSSANMFLTSMLHSDSWGNSIIAINRNAFEEVTSFEIIQPDDWDVKVVDGQAWYKIRGEMYRSSDVLHFRWWSLDGLVGVSPIRQNQMLFGKAFKAERYGTQNLGQQPPGILTYEGDMKPDQRAESQKSWENDRFLGKTPILSGRWDYKHTMVNPKDMEYVQQMDMTDQQIAGIFQVPPVFLQNYQRATWKNAEESDLIFAKHTIVPIITVIEKECNMKLFKEREKKNTYVKFNLNGLLRGDIKTRGEFYTAMRQVGAMNANEIRDKEDMNGYPEGDIYTVQAANIPVDQLREFYTTKLAPTATNGQAQKNGKHHEIFN